VIADVGYVAACLLAGVFAWAGVEKLRRPAETARAFTALGLRGAASLARAVPIVELVLAVALVTVPAVGGAVALALLAGFTVLLVGTVRAGRDVGCGCFGTASRRPVSFVDVVRNGLLAVLAVATLAVPTPRTPSLPSAIAVLAAAAAGLVVLALCDLHRTTGRVLRNEPTVESKAAAP
jgi:hypothetical protein